MPGQPLIRQSGPVVHTPTTLMIFLISSEIHLEIQTRRFFNHRRRLKSSSTIVYQSHVAWEIDVSCKWIRDFVVGMGARGGGASVATGLAGKRGEKRAGQLAVCGCAPVHPSCFRFRSNGTPSYIMPHFIYIYMLSCASHSHYSPITFNTSFLRIAITIRIFKMDSFGFFTSMTWIYFFDITPLRSWLG